MSGKIKNKFDRQYIEKILYPVMDPDLSMSIVDLGLIVDVIIVGANVTVDMTLTTPACPYGPVLFHMVETALERDPLVEKFSLNLVWPDERTHNTLSDMEKLDLGMDI